MSARRGAGVERDGVEKGVVAQRVAGSGGARRAGALEVDAAGDAPQAVGAVPDGVEAGHDGEQHLGGADVAGGFFAADMLLAGLQGQAQRGGTGGIDC